MDHFFSDDHEDNINEKIDLDDLYSRKREIEIHRLSIYKKILGRVHTKIKIAAKQKENNHFTFFVVPEFIFGVPKYNTDTCISYIIEKLTENGFIVKYTHPNLIFISWNHYIPAYERDRIKNETGITVDGFGNEIKKKDKQVLFQTNTNVNTIQNNVQKSILKNTKQYNDISNYKPLGIYNSDLLQRIQDKINKE